MKRKFLIGIAAAAFIIFMSSFAIISYTEKKIADDIWKQLGTTEKDGKYSISQSFLSGSLFTFSLKAAMNMGLGNRAAVTTELLNNVKQVIHQVKFHFHQYLPNRIDNLHFFG